MSIDVENRRVLLAARPSEMLALRNVFGLASLEGWELTEADSLQRARFLMLHNSCDVLLIDESLCPSANPYALAWLGPCREVPSIFLTAMEADTVARALNAGASMCLPRQSTMENPHLLASCATRAAAMGEVHHNLRRSADRLHQCRRQVDRLVHLVWRARADRS